MAELQHLTIFGRPATVAFMTAFNGTMVDAANARVAIVNFDDGEVGYYQLAGSEPRTAGDNPGHEFHGNQYDKSTESERCTAATLRAFGIKGQSPRYGAGVVSALQNAGYDIHLVPAEEHAQGLRTFIEQHPSGSYYLSSAGHAMALIDGVLTDASERPVTNKIRLQTVLEVTRTTPDTLYHGTSDALKDKILAEGLKPLNKPMEQVYLTTSHADATAAAKTRTTEVGGQPVVFEVRVPAEHAHKLIPSSGTQVRYPENVPSHWLKTLGDKPGHEFHGNQYGLPPVSGDPAPGGQYFYHSSDVANVERITQLGIEARHGAVSLSPHLSSVHEWSGLLPTNNPAVFRMKRAAVRAVYAGEPIDEYDEEGNLNPEYDPENEHRTTEYDPHDPGAELAAYHAIPPHRLEVYRDGVWQKLTRP